MYSFAEIKNETFSDCYLMFCGMQECTPLYSFGPAVRTEYLLHYCVSGKGYYFVNDEKYTIEAGDAFLILPNEVTFYQADKEDPWVYLWMGLAGNKVEGYLKRCGLDKEHLICHCEHPQQLVAYVNDIISHSALSYSNEMYIQGVLYQIFALFSESANIEYEKALSSKNIHVNRAIQYIQMHYQEMITVNDIADYVSVNRSYLSTLFQRELHMSPQQFLLRFRITKATELLTNSNVSIKNISYSCGYANQLAFSKAFRKITGMSPSTYRKTKTIDTHEVRDTDPHETENP